MTDCNPLKYPMEPKLELERDEKGGLVNSTEFRSIVGGLRYLTHSRLEISYAVGMISRFMKKLTSVHLKAVKHILKYVKGTLDYGLIYYKAEEEIVITGYTYSDFARDINDSRSTTGVAFYINENLVTWGSQKQQTVSLSSCEAEFMVATVAAC